MVIDIAMFLDDVREYAFINMTCGEICLSEV